MFPESLKRILNLIKTTGDRLVIFDASEPDSSYVIMDIDSYAALRGKDEIMAPRLKTTAPSPTQPSPVPNPALVPPRPPVAASPTLFPEIDSEEENLTEDDLTDTINREILMWKNQDKAAYLGEENKPKRPWQIPPQVKVKAQGVE